MNEEGHRISVFKDQVVYLDEISKKPERCIKGQEGIT